MTFERAAALIALSVMLGMLICLELGRWFGARRRAGDGASEAGLGATDGVVFALFGLLIAFTFSSAASRFDHRRELIVAEANAVGTAYLRIDLLPAETQPALRALFREYLTSRIAIYRKLPDVTAATAEHQHSVALQGAIWAQAIPAARRTGSPAVLSLVTASLNDMIDIAGTRLAATRTHLPPIIFGLLFALALVASLVAGSATAGNKRRSWLHITLFPIVIAASLFVILDLEFPRVGFIRLDVADQLLVQTLEGMGAGAEH